MVASLLPRCRVVSLVCISILTLSIRVRAYVLQAQHAMNELVTHKQRPRRGFLDGAMHGDCHDDAHIIVIILFLEGYAAHTCASSG